MNTRLHTLCPYVLVVCWQEMQVAVDGTTGRLKYISNKGQLMLKVDQTFLWYNSSDGNNINNTQKSGAYIFRWVWMLYVCVCSSFFEPSPFPW